MDYIKKKNIISLFIYLIIIVLTYGFFQYIQKNKEEEISKSNIKLQIVKVFNNSFEVKIKENNYGFKIDDIAYVSVIDNKDFSFNDYSEGEYIKATFQMIQESYPPTIIATNIKKVSEDSFTDIEIERAKEIVLNRLKNSDRELKRLSYDEIFEDKVKESYIKYGRGSTNNINENNIIVLHADFEIKNNKFGMAGKYEDWAFILIRENKDSEWIIDDQGY
jgi:Domain of unknown function (DUF4829)